MFDLFFEANQIVIAKNLNVSALSYIATFQELLRRQLKLITSSPPIILASGREMNNLPVAAGLTGARSLDTLKVIQSPVSLTKQERRRV